MSFIFDSNSEERILATVKDHWVVYVRPALFLILVWAIFLNLQVFHESVGKTLWSPEVYNAISVTSFGLLVAVHHFFFMFLIKEILSPWVITNKRVIDFDLVPLMRDDVTHVVIREIREMEKKQHGILNNLLNYGDVTIHVAENEVPVHLRYVPHPDQFVNMIEEIKARKKAPL